MTNDEIRMSKEAQMTNGECPKRCGCTVSTLSHLVIRHSFLIRISSFVILSLTCLCLPSAAAAGEDPLAPQAKNAEADEAARKAAEKKAAEKKITEAAKEREEEAKKEQEQAI